MNPIRMGANASNRRLSLIVGALVLALVATLTIASAGPTTADAKLSKQAKAKKQAAKQRGVTGVMTRNLYLGADLGPAIAASSTDDFINKNGQILRDVDTNNFKVRAKTLADEIKTKSPDLVGLQEVALWRTGVVDLSAPLTGVYNSTDVHIDYLAELMAQLNKGKQRYRVVRVQDEFDFEAPADYNGVAGDGTIPGINSNGEINGRLTMRDAILAKVGAGVKVKSSTSANFTTIYKPIISGIPVNVNRGWVSAVVKVRKSPTFKFVNTHLEAFGDDKNKVTDCMTTPAPAFASNPVSIRCTQAKELFETAIAPGSLPVVAVGDFNSDDNTVVDENCPSQGNTDGSLTGNNGGACGDTFAYNALKGMGMVDRGTEKPMSCCLNSDILTDDQGARSDFDHYIDHILTDKPGRVKRLSSSVTGLKPVNGYWPSDHAGVFSKLRIR